MPNICPIEVSVTITYKGLKLYDRKSLLTTKDVELLKTSDSEIVYRSVQEIAAHVRNTKLKLLDEINAVDKLEFPIECGWCGALIKKGETHICT